MVCCPAGSHGAAHLAQKRLGGRLREARVAVQLEHAAGLGTQQLADHITTTNGLLSLQGKKWRTGAHLQCLYVCRLTVALKETQPPNPACGTLTGCAMA